MTIPSNAALNLHEARVRLEASVLEHHGLELIWRMREYEAKREYEAIFHKLTCECIVCSDSTTLVGGVVRNMKGELDE